MDIDQLRARFPYENACREFLNPVFGKMVDIVHIATVKDLICSPGEAADSDYTSVADASANSL